MSPFNSYGPFKGLAIIGMVIFVITTIIYAQTGNVQPKVIAGLVFLGITVIFVVAIAFKQRGETVMANRIV